MLKIIPSTDVLFSTNFRIRSLKNYDGYCNMLEFCLKTATEIVL